MRKNEKGGGREWRGGGGGEEVEGRGRGREQAEGRGEGEEGGDRGRKEALPVKLEEGYMHALLRHWFGCKPFNYTVHWYPLWHIRNQSYKEMKKGKERGG